MNKPEARQLVSDLLAYETRKAYSDLRNLVAQAQQTALETQGPSGAMYQVQIRYAWNDKPENAIRIVASIDDGGLSALLPVTVSELVLRPNIL